MEYFEDDNYYAFAFCLDTNINCFNKNTILTNILFKYYRRYINLGPYIKKLIEKKAKIGSVLISEYNYQNITCRDNSILMPLIENCEDLNIQDRNGNTILMHALQQCDEYIIELLLEYGADPNIKNNNNISPNTHYNLNFQKKFKNIQKKIHEKLLQQLILSLPFPIAGGHIMLFENICMYANYNSYDYLPKYVI